MFELAERLSAALADAGAGAFKATLAPALSGCRDCGTVQVIASPLLGTCRDCGGALSVLETGARVPASTANLI